MIAFHKFKDSSSRLLVTSQIGIRSGEKRGVVLVVVVWGKKSYFVGEQEKREC